MIKIGAVVATRGPAGLLGNSFLKAIQLAKEDVKNTRHQYDLAIEEIPSPDKAEPAIEKLIKIDKVDAFSHSANSHPDDCRAVWLTAAANLSYRALYPLRFSECQRKKSA